MHIHNKVKIMPYRIKARNLETGQSIVAMDLNTIGQPVTDQRYAQQLAEVLAQRQAKGTWQGYAEYYDKSIARAQ